MNSELIPVLIGFTVIYAWTLFLGASDILQLNKSNRPLRKELSEALHSLAVYNAAKEGDMDTARLMAAYSKTKPPVSAGAKEKPKPMTGLTITQGG
jgi:hypothetical protein